MQPKSGIIYIIQYNGFKRYNDFNISWSSSNIMPYNVWLALNHPTRQIYVTDVKYWAGCEIQLQAGTASRSTSFCLKLNIFKNKWVNFFLCTMGIFHIHRIFYKTNMTCFCKYNFTTLLLSQKLLFHQYILQTVCFNFN